MSDDSSNSVTESIRWWVALSVGISGYLLSIIFIGVVASFFATETTLSNSLLYAVSSIILAISVGVFLSIKKIKLKSFFGKFALKQILFTPLYYIGYMVLSRLAQAVVGLLPNVDVNQKQDFGLESNSLVQLLMIFVALVILPPVCEEVLFRGLLYRSFRKPFGKVLGAVVVSLLFGVAHGQWNVAADTFVLSLVLIYLLEKSNSLWPAIALHFFKNLVAFLLVFVFKVS